MRLIREYQSLADIQKVANCLRIKEASLKVLWKYWKSWML